MGKKKSIQEILDSYRMEYYEINQTFNKTFSAVVSRKDYEELLNDRIYILLKEEDGKLKKYWQNFEIDYAPHVRDKQPIVGYIQKKII